MARASRAAARGRPDRILAYDALFLAQRRPAHTLRLARSATGMASLLTSAPLAPDCHA